MSNPSAFERLKLSKEFAERILSPMPMIVSSKGPREADRHWDWKASGDLGIVTPVEPTFHGLKAEIICFDEATEIKEADWKADLIGKYSKGMLEGVFTTAETTATELEPLTEEKLKESIELVEGIMGARKKKLPKKKVVKSDPRKAKYSGRMFGNILLSNTQQIQNNTTLNDALTLEGAANTTIEELIGPLFDEFIHNQGKEWQVTGPMHLAAQCIESGKWKNVSALGGEVLLFHSVVIGKRDGVCIKWTTGNIIGLDEEFMIDTTIKGFGDKLVSSRLEGNESNPANRTPLIDTLLKFAGEADVVTAAEEAKERVRVAVTAQLKADIERKSEAYGEGFGQWA